MFGDNAFISGWIVLLTFSLRKFEAPGLWLGGALLYGSMVATELELISLVDIG
jgi:hypothetical protein